MSKLLFVFDDFAATLAEGDAKPGNRRGTSIGMTEAIVFEEKGFPVELVTDRDIERAVSAGRLRPDTLVTTRRGDEPPVVRRGRDVPRLAPYFDLSVDAPELQGVEADPPSEPEPEPGPESDLAAVAEPPRRSPLPARRALNRGAEAATRREAVKADHLDPESFLGCAFWAS